MTASMAERFARPLSPQEKKIYEALMQGEQSLDDLVDLLYRDDPDGGPLSAERVVTTAIYFIRRKKRVEIKCRRVYRIEY